MSQKELAEALNISPAMVSKLAKRGMPTDTLERAQRWRKRHLEPGRVKAFKAPAGRATQQTPPPQQSGHAVASAGHAPTGQPGNWLDMAAPELVSVRTVEAVAAALGHHPTAAVIEQTPTSMVIDIGLPSGGPAPAVPRVVDLLHFSSAADWQFSSR